MTRAYSARLVALTIGVPIKWVDNLLSHHALPGIVRSRQGVERQITDEGLIAIETVRLLTTELGLPLSSAAVLARAAIESRAGAEMRFTTKSGVTVLFPLAEMERRVRDGLLEAIEAIARVPRGRPRREPALG